VVNVPSQPEIITVNSEDLQTQIRDLLPSQNGFGSELQASNVIFPIIDLTRSAEGSGLPEYLQRAASFGGITAFDVINTTTTIINTTGFFQIDFYLTMQNTGSASGLFTMDITDGVSSKQMFEGGRGAGSTVFEQGGFHQMLVFMSAGHSLSITSGSTSVRLAGYHRQVATGDGTLVSPNGFPL
jgi:hypothetical protein